MHDIEADILKLAAKGDIEAFEKIYRVFSSFVYNVAFRITRNSSDAQEVTQDVFMKIYSDLKGFRFRSAFKTWVYRVAVNTAINRYRKSTREHKGMLDYDSIPGALTATASTDGELTKSDNEAALKALLEDLNPQYKACLILREIEGFSYREIAATLRIPLNTVRSRLKRSREALLEAAGKRERKDGLQKNTGTA